MELFICIQAERQPLRDFWRRFVQLRAKTPDIIDDSVIIVATNGVRPGPCAYRLTRKPPKHIAELHKVMEKYIRLDTVHRSKTEAFWPQNQPPTRQQQRNQYPRNDAINVNTSTAAKTVAEPENKSAGSGG
jgi:hypothetical protein